MRTVLTILAALLLSSAANAQQIGQTDSVTPEANGTIAGKLSVGTGVHANETVNTGTQGQAGLGFLDQSKLHVGPKSQVKLDKFVYDPNKSTSNFVLQATKGTLRFSSGKQNGSYQVKTPYGTLGIRS